MKAIRRALLACVLCASSSLACADSIEQKMQFDCDVPAGKASDWIGTITPQLQQVTGTIELLEPREHERWWPVASVFLMYGEEKVGLQLYRDRKTQESLQVAVLRPKSEGGRSVLTSVPWKGSPLAFRLSVNESGDVQVSAAGKDALLGLKNAHLEKLSLSCSSAQFKFREVAVQSQQAHVPTESPATSPQAEQLQAASPPTTSL